MMPAYGSRNQTQLMDGIAVVGEALRRVAPETAEFLIEITAGGATGSQAIQNHQTKTTQIAQAVSTLGVQRSDLQIISQNVVNGYAPMMQMGKFYKEHLTQEKVDKIIEQCRTTAAINN